MVAADHLRARPSRSRLTIRPAGRVPVARSPHLGDVLRASREALSDIGDQLDALLAAVRSPGGRFAPEAPDRLRLAARRAGAAFDHLTDL